MNIGTNIRKVREFKNYTQTHVAEKLGIKQKAYSKIESGETKMTIDRLEEIANALDTDVKKLLDFDEKYIYQNLSPNYRGDSAVVINKENSEIVEKLLAKIEDLYEARLQDKELMIDFLKNK